MSHYQQLILEGIRRVRPERADTETAVVIEDLMRTNRTALDHLSREDFLDEAADLADVIDASFVRELCENMDYQVPAWAR